MEATDALFNVVEASLALAGFAGIVTALSQPGAGTWRRDDRDRIVNLMLSTLLPFGSSLLGLTLLYAEVASVWRVSSATLALLVVLGSMIGARGLLRGRQEPEISISTSYVAAIYVTAAVSLALQFANVVRINAFWPYFAGLASTLCIAASQFARLLWFGIRRERTA